MLEDTLEYKLDGILWHKATRPDAGIMCCRKGIHSPMLPGILNTTCYCSRYPSCCPVSSLVRCRHVLLGDLDHVRPQHIVRLLEVQRDHHLFLLWQSHYQIHNTPEKHHQNAENIHSKMRCRMLNGDNVVVIHAHPNKMLLIYCDFKMLIGEPSSLTRPAPLVSSLSCFPAERSQILIEHQM